MNRHYDWHRIHTEVPHYVGPPKVEPWYSLGPDSGAFVPIAHYTVQVGNKGGRMLTRRRHAVEDLFAHAERDGMAPLAWGLCEAGYFVVFWLSVRAVGPPEQRHNYFLRSRPCGNRDPHSPRVCGRPGGHQGLHAEKVGAS